ncbi:MAG: sensory histidine kinase AtoS [Methanoregula sp. PtaU1.Bin051]|nr:MAG: sensory histidine kinase AtoS [Methanoregula sp. PtaU1.Bin051]
MYTALYVDDEADFLDIAKAFLESSGEFRLDTRISAQEGLKALNERRYDAIISDYQMPGMDGIAFLKEVRSSFGNIPFIIFTGRGREEVVIQALNNGADFYLQKGGDPEAQYAELMHVTKRTIQMRQAQATLIEQEQRYHDLQNASDLIQSVKPDGHFLFVNRKWLDTLGYKEDELKNITLFDIIHEESQQYCHDLFPRILAGENVGIIEVIFKTRDGKKVYIEGLANCKITDGKPQYTRGIFKDITDRKNAEEALRQSEEKFRTLVEYTLDGILILDLQGTILFANQAAGRIIEAENYNEMIGIKNVREFLAPESREAAVRDFSQVAQGIDGYLATYKVITKRGQERWVESVGKTITFERNPAILISLRDITDRKQAEEALRRSEKRYRNIIENIQDVVYQTDRNGKLIMFSPHGVKLAGYDSEEEMIGLDVALDTYMDPKDRERFLAALSEKGFVENYPLVLKTKTGTPRYVTASSHFYHDDYGNVLGVEGILHDITDLKGKEQALRESEERYRALYNDNPVMLFTLDPDGIVISVNEAGSKQLGYSAGELEGQSVLKVFYPNDHAAVKEQLKVCLKSPGGVFHWQFRKVKKDGSVIWVDEHARAMPDPAGNLSVLVVCQDITDRKRAEEELKKSEEQYRSIIENLQDVYYRTDAEGNLLFVSPSALTVFGIDSVSQYLGRNVAETLYSEPEDRRKFLAELEKSGSVYNYEVRLKKQDGTVVLVSTNSHKYFDDSGKFLGVEGILRDITGLKRAELDLLRKNEELNAANEQLTATEEELRESENKFRTIFENSPYPIAINSIPDGKFIEVNDAFLEASGYTEDEVIGKSPVDLGLLSLLDFGKLSSNLLLKGKLDNVPMVLKGKAGKPVHVLFSVIPVTINNRSAILTMTVEITKLKLVEEELIRKNEDLHSAYEELAATEEELRQNYEELIKKEQELRASEEKYRLLTENTSDIIYTIDLKGTVTHVSPQISRYGYTKEEVLSRNFSRFFVEEDLPGVMEDLGKILATKQPAITQLRGRDKAGKVYWMEANASPVLDPSGTVVAVSGIMRDVTARKEAEIALRESEEKFRALVEHSLDGILITDFTGKLLFANQAAGSIVDADNYQSLIGRKNVMDYVAPESIAEVMKDFSKVAQGIDAYLVHYKLITDTGRKIWVECIGKKIAFGGSEAMLVSLRDITSRKQMEEAILRTNKQLSLLSSVTRHDVLNKISVIQGYLSIIRKKGLPEESSPILDKIETTTETIKSQVEFTRIYQTLGTKEPEWQKPGRFLSPAILPESMTFSRELGELEIYADLMLEKVFFNLIENSIRHGEKVTEIRMHYRKDPDGITIFFEDNGVGIPAEEKERIFERGYGKNTGLGLFLAREILGITGITIKETGEPGKGARFEINVPAIAYRIAAP